MSNPRSKWAPGSWQAAPAYNRTKPELRCPVLGGDRNMIRTPEELRDICKLESVPELIQTIETGLIPDENEEDEKDKKKVYVCDVSARQFLDLSKITEGDMVVVWFRGERRYAWLAREMKTQGSIPG